MSTDDIKFGGTGTHTSKDITAEKTSDGICITLTLPGNCAVYLKKHSGGRKKSVNAKTTDKNLQEAGNV